MTADLQPISNLLTSFRQELDLLVVGDKPANVSVQQKADQIMQAFQGKKFDFLKIEIHLLIEFREHYHEAYARFCQIRVDGRFKQWFGTHPTIEKAGKALAECGLKVIDPVEQLRTARLAKIVDKIKDCSVTKALYDEAMKAGPLAIRFSNDKKSLTFGGFCSFKQKTIFVSEMQTQAQIKGIILFELINACNRAKFDKVHENAREIGCEEFVRQMAEIEFEGSLRHHKMIVEAATEQPKEGWMACARFASHTTFEKFWVTYKTSAHADHYRQIWKENYSSLTPTSVKAK